MKCTKPIRSLLLALSLTMTVNTTRSMEPTPPSGITNWMTENRLPAGIILIGGILLGIVSLNTLFQKPEKVEYFNQLPTEIKTLIIMATGENLQEAAHAINSLAQTNKEFNTLINDSQFSLNLINHLAQKFMSTQAQICRTLQTKAANEYFINADMNATGETILMQIIAMSRITAEDFETLLKNPTLLINKRSQSGMTALMHALLYAKPTGSPFVQFPTTSPSDAMHDEKTYALYRKPQPSDKTIEYIKLLLQYGADPELADMDGKTPLDIAQETGNQTIIQMIKAAIIKKRIGPQAELLL